MIFSETLKGIETMNKNKKIYFQGDLIGTEVSDVEFDTLTLEELEQALERAEHGVYCDRDGNFTIFNRQVDDIFHRDGGWIYDGMLFFNQRELVGTISATKKLTADEIRQAIKASYCEGWGQRDVCRELDGTICLFETGDGDFYTYEDGRPIEHRTTRFIAAIGGVR